ncbi:3-hydroxyacyl-CoA dehydrogenase [Rhodobacteraceae bacterium NNCM2]|nr:3-hydroxyacyl-CoA dehydrogenase [Coraliihabitans acroporae]
MNEIKQAATIGAGVIGASWTALFLAHGTSVAVYDPAPDAEKMVRDYVANAWPVLEQLGLVKGGDPDAVSFHDTAAAAVEGAEFIQESVPERIAIKHEIFAAMEPALMPGAIVSSSASGLTLTEMQEGWTNPSHFVLGHPFNPPHLIPLVEVMGNEKTAEGVVDRTEKIYEGFGKTTIRVRKEIPGHVANRLQAALWREAISMIEQGVATVEDVDKAIWAGPGLRWAAMGPTLIWHLAAGPGGMQEYCNRFGDSFHRWWDSMGDPRLNPETVKLLVDGVNDEAAGRSLAVLEAERDALIVAMQKATANIRSTS